MKTNNSKILNGRRVFDCVCDLCGAAFERRSDQLNFRFCVKCSNKERGKKSRTHGENNKNSRLHVTWSNMKRRCLNPVGKEKETYKGVDLCEEWHDYSRFKEWALSNGYKDDLTIDRIDGNKGYYPENCRFCDYSTQNVNRLNGKVSKTGFTGVYESGRAFRACIDWKRKRVELGVYDSIQEAVSARDKYIEENGLPHKKSKRR